MLASGRGLTPRGRPCCRTSPTSTRQSAIAPAIQAILSPPSEHGSANALDERHGGGRVVFLGPADDIEKDLAAALFRLGRRGSLEVGRGAASGPCLRAFRPQIEGRA